ncbi:single-stranded DNA-binding protein [Streptomyces sp. NBC_01618]|uniref:single-stranded DNA-binding protein n=1 Tax=Streptomyces sp. NBC_01618 TaxID=2975900 RepID=UPI00386EAD49|nr:single-stranded DNA-binding protein [Streptomyces sp. NBC_01618]
MNDTLVTLVGNAATGVEFRETATGGMARFRFAVTPRRWDREKQFWTDGNTSFYTVWAWRALASNLSGSVSIGEPLVVHGRLKVREEEREGLRRTFVDIEAVAVGHDLARGTAAFRRVTKGDPRSVARAGSVDRGVDAGGTSPGSGEPDWSGGRDGRTDRAEPAGRGEQGEEQERVGRQRSKRPTGRQKGGQELVSAP